MNGMRISRRERERRLNRVLMIAFALVLLIGVLSQIAMMARLSRQSKQIVAVEEETHALSVTIGNLKLSLNQYHNLDRINARAQQLGMQRPGESQLRVVNLPTLADGTSTQSADNTGAEEMMD